jgi:hypothetical protein
MIILNGHEYVERKARACSIPFTKVDNCFTDVPNAAALAGIADTMTFSDGGGGRLADVCERWIYSTCLCFALELADQQKTAFTYAYSVFQAEYSRNLLFTRGHILDKVFDSVIDRTRTTLDMRSVKTIFGRRNRPKNLRKHTRKPRFEIVVEKPTYNLTVFKIHFGKLTVKMYSKGERVLRIEAIAHNTADLRKGRSIQRFTEIIQKLASIVDSFLDKVHCVDVPTIHDLAPDEWYKPGTINGHRVSGVDVNKPRTRAFMQALTALSISPKALSAATVAAKVREMAPDECSGYTVRQAAYDLRKFRAKGLITKKDRGKTYHITDEALRVITAYFIIRDKVIIPVLQCCGDRKRIKTNQKRSKADIHIAHMQKNMIELFSEFRMVA